MCKTKSNNHGPACEKKIVTEAVRSLTTVDTSKNIFILWFQGFNNAPDVVKQCANSWKHYNPDWNIIELDNDNLSNFIRLNEYIPDIDKKTINYTALSDIVRVLLLKTYGGVWVDATTFCNKPLTSWLENYTREGFFAFNNPGRDRLLSTWFLYADKDNYLIDKWVNAVINYYKIKDKPHAYFWVHYLFGDLYKADNRFKANWDKVLKLPAFGKNGPYYLQGNKKLSRLSSQNKTDIDSKIAPLYKLTYKCKFPNYDESIQLYYLYSTIRSNR